MAKFYDYLRGYVTLEFCGASPGWALNRLSEAKIAFWDIQWMDALTVQVKVFRGKEQEACRLAELAMCDSRILGSFGIFKVTSNLLHRPVLLAMLFVCLTSILILPCFVFFFDVEGNETVPEELILRELENAGVSVGTYGPNIYPRRVKDHMIEALPKLQWVTVMQRGCRAAVIVREREDVPETQTKKGLANVIAAQGGVITQQSVFTGQAQYQIGDTVSKGDILVSGIVDLERTYLLERANAEVFARTWRQIPVCIPSSYMEKTSIGETSRCIWVILGGKRIKIFGNSGISYDSCDKMINTKKLTLPKGLSLPVSLEIETFTFYKKTEREMQKKTAEQLLKQYASSCVTEQMQAGEILRETYALKKQKGTYCLDATLECHEMIARVVEAKWNNEEFIND